MHVQRKRKGGIMASTSTGAPTTKVISGTIGAAIATLIIWGLKEAKVPGMDDEGLRVAITTITFLFGYLVPPAPGDNVV